MIKEFEFYHGAVLSQLIHADIPVSVKLYPTKSNASYIVNGRVGVYVKHCAKRMSPWRFSFQKSHQDEILKMKNDLGEMFLALVCHDDGIAVLSFNELKMILNEVHEDTEWISVTRKPREKYTVKGSDGKLKYKIGDNEFPKKVLEAKPQKSKEKFTWFK